MRTGKIGLAAFRCKRRVPGFPTPAFCCGAQWETAKHVVLECPRLQRVRRSLYTAAATTDYQAMISPSPRGSYATDFSPSSTCPRRCRERFFFFYSLEFFLAYLHSGPSLA